MGRAGLYTGFCWGNLRETDHLEDPGIDGRIILKRVSKKWDEGYGLGFTRVKIGTGCRLL